MERKWGWRPDLPDPRDLNIKSLCLRGLPRKLPASTDLRKHCSSIEDQKWLGSCTAHALSANMEFLRKKAKRSHIDFSRLFIYYEERKLEGTIREDAGAQLRTGIKVLAKLGAAPENLWPYDLKKWKTKPSKKAYQTAGSYQILKYVRLNNLYEVKRCLAAEYPVVFGFLVFKSCMSSEVGKTGLIPTRGKKDSVLGGHAVMAVGYDDKKNAVLIRNSWGKRWGIEGYGWLPYTYLESRDLSDDFWSIQLEEM